jgi:glycosyl transferase, family 25
MTKIYIINLNSSKERRINILHQINSMGLEAGIFGAVDGRKHDHELFSKYDPKLRWRKKSKSLTRGQLGCFVSHYLLWEKCVEMAEPIIILEDDAILLKENFKIFYDSLSLLSPDYECIRLTRNFAKHHKSIFIENLNNLRIVKYTKGPMMSVGYYLTPTAAQKFLMHAKRWFLPVDIYMDRFWVNGVECYGVMPECVTYDSQAESTIDYSNMVGKKRTFWVKCQREFFSFTEMVRRRMHNLKFRAKRSFT